MEFTITIEIHAEAGVWIARGSGPEGLEWTWMEYFDGDRVDLDMEECA